MPKLSTNSYGKSNVRLTKVRRVGDRHEMKEINVRIILHGDFEDCYTKGDNSLIVPTDTMKNTVYALAKDHELASIESFADMLVRHFVNQFDQVRTAQVLIWEDLWQRISVDGHPHDHAFIGGSREHRGCEAMSARNAPMMIKGRIDGMNLLKTTRSGFVGYVKDQFTTLKETTDRLFGTMVEAVWTYDSRPHDWNVCYESIRNAILHVFATHDSLAVQQTLYAMGQAALSACDGVMEIYLSMPNKHRLLANLEPFGMENPNEVFVTTSEPYGLIAGTIKRG